MNEFLESIPPQILDKSVNIDLEIKSSNCLEAVKDALEKTVLSGGKRLRPMLTYLMADFFNAHDKNDVTICARAIEMVHAASLAHDDVIDNATQRRGNPSINVEASNKKAVLAGDYLLADVILSLSQIGSVKILQTMSQVIQELAIGEWIQSDALESRIYSKEVIEKIAFHKTASVMGWCCWSGAYVGLEDEEIANKAARFGHLIGIAFQMIDDTLDFSDGESLKDAHLDLEANLVNSVIYDYLDKNPLKMDAYQKGEDLKDIVELDQVHPNVENIKSEANALIEEANDILHEIRTSLLERGFNEERLSETIKPLELIGGFILNRKS
ncbi:MULTISPECIES: polyprenyl synthetase family protein [Halobacteriovorax]|uniref:Polyprenyl synthetase family protein n=1 Tax=Halobacteriovorax vibrionivorans TaxID=2152716 RepID=A0ABY0ID32_9BACT|nr:MULTISPECIES: polyprenyl synthetase family protein [Halobacteriovorax]AYF44505.1 polyprenyl synthetase [Halobacteriovorax sp. BALOs_7]RZF20562.1 polyprenyl synthetase family protein [Halobacteriovorax vibrionivorans]TGD47475.1 polyprenyl synthetase family protein [Halobacteriovorax sp. Y22]